MGNTLFILAVIVYFIVNWISFPSYNIAISLIALHSGAQEETPERDTTYQLFFLQCH